MLERNVVVRIFMIAWHAKDGLAHDVTDLFLGIG